MLPNWIYVWSEWWVPDVPSGSHTNDLGCDVLRWSGRAQSGWIPGTGDYGRKNIFDDGSMGAHDSD